MTRPWRVVAALAFGLLACDESSGPSGSGTGGLTIQVASTAGAAAIDSGYVRLSGPTGRLMKVVPGASVRIDSLLPGAYTVELEGFEGPNFSHYTKATGVTVVIGQTATATIPAMARVRLVFAVQPTTIGLGRSIAPGVVVNLVDGSGTLITSPSARNTIALGITTNPSGAAFTTAQSVAAVNGVATFGSVALNEAGVGYVLGANGTSLTGVASTAFNVTNRALVTHSSSASVSIIETSTRTKVGASITVGSAPYEDVAFTADGAFAYVPNNASSNVSVINMATAVVAATIPAGTGPRGLAFGVTSNGPRVYVPNNTSNDVTVINTATNTVVTTIPVGVFAIRVALTPDGSKAFVTNFSGNTVSVINTATNTVIATVPVGLGPQGIVVNPAGTFAYVTNSQASSIQLINTATHTAGPPIAVGNFPVGIVVHPNGQFVYVVNQTTPSISVITAATSTVTATIPLPAGRNIAISPSGRFLYVPNQQTLVYVFNTATNTLVDSIAVGPATGSVGVGFAPKP